MPDKDRLAVEIARKQGGVISRRQVENIGYSRRQVDIDLIASGGYGCSLLATGSFRR